MKWPLSKCVHSWQGFYNICLNKTIAHFGAILENYKCFKVLFILNIHILKSEDGCFTVTVAPKLQTFF